MDVETIIMDISIVVIDDLEFMRIAIREALQHTDIRILAEGVNGKDAIRLYEQYKPDILLLDITMPVLDGLSALKMIKSKHNNANVVMCSALSEEEYILKAIFLGAKDFIVKPFSKQRLASCLKRVSETI